jgi:hypothetical protein
VTGRQGRFRLFHATGKPSRAWWTALLLTLAAPGPAWSTDDPAQVFDQLERTLLASDFALDFQVVSHGAYEARLDGSVAMRGPHTVRLEADGHFAGEPAAIRLAARDDGMRGGNGDAAFASDTPAALRDALVLGLTRMGILHNLAVMSAGSPPDHGEGGVREWVRVDDVRPGKPEVIDGVPAKTLCFQIVVNGSAAATATLWLREDSGLPLRREQVVRFDGSEMRVVESYRNLTLYPR